MHTVNEVFMRPMLTIAPSVLLSLLLSVTYP
jgi:hypothetical protein